MDPFTIFVTVVSIISGVASYQQAKKIQREVDRESRGVEANIESNIKAIPVVYGERRVGGVRVYIDTSKDIGNKYLYMVMAMAEGEVEDIHSIEVDDIPITDEKFILSGLGANFTYEIFYGSDTQSASELIIDGVAYSTAAEVPPEVALYLTGQEGDKPWNQNHQLNGVAYLAMRFLWDSNAYNGVPNVTAIVKGKKVYDPRNPSAPKAWSANPALCIRDYLTSTRYGKGIPESAINDTMIAQAANDYDSFVVTPYDGGDDITLFEMNTVLDTEVEIIKNLNDMLMSCRGFLPYVDGKYGMRVDQATNHVMEVNSDHIIGGISIAGTKKEDRFNQVKVNFFNKDKEYKEDTAVFPDVDDPSDVNNLYQTYLAEDGGEPLVDDIKIDGISNYYTAREMAKLFLLRSRLGTAIGFRGTSELMELEVGDTFLITQPTPAWTNKKFQVQEIGLNFDGTVNIQAIEYSDAIYTYNTASEETPFVPTKLPNPNKLAPVTAASASAGSFIDTDGRTVPFIDISWTAPNDALVDRYEIKYTIDDEAVIYSAVAIDTTHRIVEAKGSYDIEIYAVNGFGAKSTGVTLSDVVAVADTSAPSNITGVSISSALQSISLKWTNPIEDDFDLVRIKVAATNAEPTTHSFEVRSDSFVHDIGAYSTTKYYWLAPVDRTGNVGNYVSGGTATTGSIAIGDVPAVAGTFYLTLGNNDAPTNAEFLTAIGRNPIEGDVVVVNKAYFFTRGASTWTAVTEFIDGSLLVSGSVAASQIDVTGLITSGSLAVTGDLPTAVSDLTNDTGFITSVSWAEVTSKPTDLATDTDVDNAINDIKVSGRNLVSAISLDGSPTDGVYGGKKYARKLARNLSNYRIDNWDGLSKVRPSGKYSLSFWVKVHDASDSPITGDRTLTVDIGDANYTNYTVNSDWQYCTIENVNVSTYLGSPYYGFIDLYVADNIYIYVSNVKLEYGTKVTEWSPAPEDVESSAWYSLTGRANTSAPSNSDYLTAFNRNPVQGDILLVTDTNGTSKNYQYNGDSWDNITALIRGDMLVSGTVTASQIAADAITAEKIDVTNLSAISADLGDITGGSIDINSGTFTVDSDGNLTGTSVNLKGDITAQTLTLTGAQVEDSRSSPSLILNANQLDQSVVNLIDQRIEGYGLASSGDFKEDIGGFNNTIPDHPVLENFTHLNGKDVVIELSASSTWSGTGTTTLPPQPDNPALVIEIQRRISTETNWDNAVIVDTITNGTSPSTVITGGNWVYGYSTNWFNGLTINYTFNDDPATGTYDYRAFIKTIGDNYTGVSKFYFEANEAGTASGGGVNNYANSFSIADATGIMTIGRSGLTDLTADISTYVGNQVSALVDSAPATLDTLNELAAALGDDANFAQTTATALGTKWTQDNTKISNWDTAYGWGNHASAGYLTSLPSHNHNDLYYTETESDARFVRSNNGVTTNNSNLGLVVSSNMSIDHTGNVISKISSDNNWDGHVYSSIGFTGGCIFRYSPTNTDRRTMVGINSDPTANSSYTSIDYCFYIQVGASLIIYESGASIGTGRSYAVGDELAIIYDNDKIKYYHNNELVRTVATTSGRTFYFDSSFYDVYDNYTQYLVFEPYIEKNDLNTLSISGTTVIDASRNLTNIGTISASGGISVSGYNTISSYAGSFNFITGSLTGNVTGNASSATKWATARTLSLTGDVTGSVSIDGSANASITATVANDSHTHDGRYYTETESNSRFVGKGSLGLIGNSDVAFGTTASWANNPVSGFYKTDYVGYSGLVFMTGDVGGSTSSIGLEFAYNGQIAMHSNTDSSQWTSTRIFTDNYHPNADKWTTAKVLTLTGDVSGTVTWDGSANASMLVVVGDDSHSHSNYITSNADDTTSGSISTAVNKYFGYASTYKYTPYATGGIGTRSELLSAANFLIHADTDGSGTAEFVSIRAGAGTANELKLLSKTSAAGVNNQALTLNGNKVFNDAYHPNADKWTTARTLSLTGDVSGSVSWDGSGNASLTTTVADDSHNHSNYLGVTRRTGCSNAGAGWYRIAVSTASSGRGSFQISLFGYGGTNAPEETIIKGTMGYGTTAPSFISIENARGFRATKVRGVQDGGYAYIEVYFPSAFTNLGVHCTNFGIGNFRVTDTAILSPATGTESAVSVEYDIIASGKVLLGDTRIVGYSNAQSYQIDGQTVIDSSRNATFNSVTTVANVKATDPNLKLWAGGNQILNIDLNGKIYPNTHNAFDLGYNSVNAFRNLYLSNSIVMGGSTVIDSSRNISGVNLDLSGRASIWTNTDAALVLRQGQSGHPWNYIEFRNSTNDRNWYTGTDSSGNYVMQGETGATGVYTNKRLTAEGLTSNAKTYIDSDHGSTRLQLKYRHNGVEEDGNSGHLTLWTSEPGISYDNCGIGGNVNVSGQHYGRQINSNPYGVYLRFDVNSGFSEFWSTTGSAGTTGGKGTRRWYVDASGNTNQTGYAAASEYKIGATTVIDSSRNLTNIGTIQNGSVWINSGANFGNYNENIRLFDPSANSPSVIAFGASGTSGTPRHSILSHTDDTYGFDFRDGAASVMRLRDSGVDVKRGGFLVNGTTVIDSSRNLTNIGTVTSGNIYAGNITSTVVGSNYNQVNSTNSGEAMHRYSNSVSNYWYTGIRSSTQLVGNTGYHIYSTAAAQTVMGLTAGGELRAKFNVVAYYSDERLKTKVSNLDNALSKVCSLNGFIYVENDKARELGYTNTNEQVALSAQEVQNVLPQAVSLAPIDCEIDENGNDVSISGENYLTVDYAKLVPLLVEAIKELKQEIEELKNGTNSN